MVLERVGYTAKATAAIVTQDPTIRLRGYPRARVECQLAVADAGGRRATARMTRCLVQVGFGDWRRWGHRLPHRTNEGQILNETRFGHGPRSRPSSRCSIPLPTVSRKEPWVAS
eukprot:8493601-Pyramimonas_sp.AAC.1